MLTLHINGKPLITNNDFSCRISLENPFFIFDNIRGPLTSEISLPAKENQGNLNHPNQVTKRAQQNDRHFSGATLKHYGLPLIEGDFVVTQALGSIEGWIQNHVGKMGEELRELTLTELDLSELLTFVNKTTFDPDTDPWCTIRLMNRGFWKDKGAMVSEEEGGDVEELTNKFESHSEFFVNANHANGVVTTAGTDGVAVVSPFPFLHWLIDKILRAYGFYMSDNFLKLDADLKTLCLYTSFNILKNTSNYTEKEFTMIDWFAATSKALDFKQISDSTWGLDQFLLSDLLPKIDIKTLLLSTQNETNTFFWFNNNRTVQLIDRESIFAGEAFNLGKYRVSDWEPGERKDVCIKFSREHDGDDSAFNDAFEELDNKRNKFKEPVATYDDLKSILILKEEGDIRLVENENRYYEYAWFPISEISGVTVENDYDVLGWRPASIGLQNYYFNDGDREQEEIKTKFSTLRMADDGHPVAYQNGNSDAFSSIKEPFSPRLLFYKGNNTGGDESVTGKKLDWKGDHGIVLNRYRLTAPFLAGLLPLKAQFRLPPNVLHYVMQNIYQKMYDVECEFMIEKLDADPGPDEETLCEISAYKIEDNFWQFNPGVVPGGGDGTNADLVPKFVGVNQYGKPYLIDADGEFKTTSVFGTISTADYAHNCCVDYNPATNQLIVGGNNGYVHIYDLSEGFKMVSVQFDAFPYTCSGVKFCNGKVLIGTNNVRRYYYFNQGDVDSYSNAAIGLYVGSTTTGGFGVRDFHFFNGYYYMVSITGEIMRCDTNFENNTELHDWDAEFTRIVETDSRLMVFGIPDRQFSCLKSELATDGWAEFDWDNDIGLPRHPETIEAKSNGERVIALTADYYHVIIITGIDPETHIRKQVNGYPKGIAVVAGEEFISAASLSGSSGSLYKVENNNMVFQFTLPDGLNIYAY